MEIQLVKSVLAENESLALNVQEWLTHRKASMFNFMSSPGSGKTALLEVLVPQLQQLGMRVSVIEGDITTTKDAQRIAKLNIPVAQINTDQFGGDCHLGANSILAALDLLAKDEPQMVLIENVGNLVCPAEFNTGAHKNVVVLSVTEGEDKPLKYPLMFRRCQLALINKVDLVGVLGVSVTETKNNMRAINPDIEVLETSGRQGTGIAALAQKLMQWHQEVQA